RHPGVSDLVPMTGPYTPRPMDAARSSDETRAVRDVRIDGLRAEASEAVSYGANTRRAVSQRYRQAYADELARWQSLRNELDEAERAQELGGPRLRALPDRRDASADEAETSQPDVVAFERARIQRL